MATLEWNKLLCTKRERESKSGSSINPVRNEFEADYDRIVGSSSVRRLQDKAQVSYYNKMMLRERVLRIQWRFPHWQDRLEKRLGVG